MRFRRDESGSVTVEFVLWVPLVVALLLVAVDVSIAFMGMGNMWQVSRETARVVSRYGMTEQSAESWAATQTTFTQVAPTVDVAFETGDVIVTMTMPFGAMAPFGMMGIPDTFQYTTQVRHAMEPL